MNSLGSPDRPRQRDIAARLGLSQATISLVLNGKGGAKGVSAATQEAILSAASELGYVPNVAARSLAGGRSGLMGVYTFDSVFPRDTLNFYHPFLIGIEEEAERIGVDLVLFTSAHSSKAERSIYGSQDNRLRLADGSILLGEHTDRSELVRLAAESYPFVHIGRRGAPGQEFAYVSADYVSASEQVFQHLADLGHRRICYLTPTSTDEPTEDRQLGFTRASRQLGLTSDEQRLIYHEAGRLPHDEVLAAHRDGSTAFVTHHSEDALEVYEVLRNAGLVLARDYSLAALDEPVAFDSEQVRLTGFRLPRVEMGIAAVAALQQILSTQVRVTPQIQLACRLVAGTSTASVPYAPLDPSSSK